MKKYKKFNSIRNDNINLKNPPFDIYLLFLYLCLCGKYYDYKFNIIEFLI